MTFINLTPHDIRVVGEGGETVAVMPRSGDIARVSSSYDEVARQGDVVLQRQSYGDVEGLPAPEPGVTYVVSALVRLAAPSRSDLASPGQLVRDAEGRPVGCQGFVVS